MSREATPTRSRVPLLAGGLSLVLALGGACAPVEGPEERGASPVAYVAEARTRSRAAEEATARGDHAVAARALEGLLRVEVPTELREEDARVIRQDAHDRLAQARLRLGDLEGARRSVEAGLAIGEAEDLFTANLLTTRGRVAEAEGRDAEAADDYHRALVIHEALLDDALGGER